jgi:hypothetical protein
MRARERPGMPSIWQGPSPRNVLSDARLGTSLDSRLGHRDSRSRRLVHPRGALAGLPEARSPSTRPVANGRHASLDPGVACRLLQPDTTRGHTLTSVRPSHASGAFAPLLAGTNRCRLRWPVDALPPRWPASRDPYTATCVRRVPLAWTGRIAGRDARAKAIARSWTNSRVPSS